MRQQRCIQRMFDAARNQPRADQRARIGVADADGLVVGRHHHARLARLEIRQRRTRHVDLVRKHPQVARAQARVLAALQVQRGVFDGLVHGGILRGQPVTLSHPRGFRQAARGVACARLAYFCRGFSRKGSMMRLPRLACWLLIAGTLSCTAAVAAELPVSNFVKHPTLTNPVISPDGKYLAVVVNENTNSTDADFQLAVLQLPDLKPVSRLDMAPRYMPYDVHWVSNTRVIMGLANETGTLVAPSATGDIIAVDYDGSHKKSLYSWRHRGGTFSGVNSLDIPLGWPSIAGIPHERNGHFYISLIQMPGGSEGDTWQDGTTSLYNVDADSGHAARIAEIRHGDMQILQHDNVARIAV